MSNELTAPTQLSTANQMFTVKNIKISKVDMFNALADGKSFGDMRSENSNFTAIVSGVCFSKVASETDYGEIKVEDIVYILTDKGGLVSKSKVVIQKLRLLVELDLFSEGPVKLAFSIKQMNGRSINTVRVVK